MESWDETHLKKKILQIIKNSSIIMLLSNKPKQAQIGSSLFLPLPTELSYY